MTVINWNTLIGESKTGGVLPDGSYDVIVVDATAATSSTGKPMFKLKFRVTSGPQRDKQLLTQLTLSAENATALRIFFRHMAALGLDETFFTEQPTPEDVASALLNRGATVEVGTREWRGEARNDVVNIVPLQLTGPPPPGLVTGLAVAGTQVPASSSPSSPPIPRPMATSSNEPPLPF